MELSGFITTLLLKGKVSVKGQIDPFESNDTSQAKQLLKKYYEEDSIEMPYTAPGYSEEAALWAGEYLYKAVQLTVLRDAGEEVIKEHLKPYAGHINPSTIFSADLMLRYLPQLFELAKGLAPNDILVLAFRQAAAQWPFSSIGIELEESAADEMILEHLSLRYAYIDRIIGAKEKQRIKNPLVTNYIHEVTGEHLSSVWPEFEKL